MSVKSLKTGTVSMGLLLVAVALACAQTRPPAAKAASGSFPVDTRVTLDVKQRSVRPLIALIPPGAGLELAVVGLADGQSLEIDFVVQGGSKGPFAKAAASVRGRYLFRADSVLASGPEDVGRDVVWKYDVVVRDKGEADLWALDPMIVVRR